MSSNRSLYSRPSLEVLIADYRKEQDRIQREHMLQAQRIQLAKAERITARINAVVIPLGALCMAAIFFVAITNIG